jgi:hypothetical protein
VDPALTVAVFGVGAAMIGFWAVARFPTLGPQRVSSSLVFAAVMFVGQMPLLGLVDPVKLAAGIRGALLFVILPSLTLLFWAAGCLVRSLVALATPHRS